MLCYKWYLDEIYDLSTVTAGVRSMLKRCDFYEKVPEDNLFLTIHDAVITALAKKRELLEEVMSRKSTSTTHLSYA